MFQHPKKSITLSQAEYVKKIQPIKVSLERRKHETENVTPEERPAFRGLIGSLQYASVHTRPDLASRLSHLQSSINSSPLPHSLTPTKHPTKQRNIQMYQSRFNQLRVRICQTVFIQEEP